MMTSIMLESVLIFTDIWMVGDSLLFWGEDRADMKGLTNFQLEKDNVRVRWFGIRGMHWAELKSRIQYLIMLKARPFIIVIHLGGNDVVCTKLRTLQKKIENDVQYLFSSYPGILFVWSDILPRLKWKGVQPEEYPAMERKRGCINRTARRVVASSKSGRVVVHNNFDDTAGLFWNDGIHLSEIGSDLLLANLQEALRLFVKTDKVWYTASE